MTLLLAYEEWSKGLDLRKWEVNNADDAVAGLQQCMVDFMPLKDTDRNAETKD
eukprot:CAMPEP_0183738402 /NCGR_PEP_ID=MMETSP0737-20130205/54460_1 /TAXON_ID=385413 /ORGANISM="Thalassiosira miniscula, Strain CCMP1093" /LENGTH=52 /DNA_ID=CAMNT_0025972923 /DNA_START=40 /DNA_END=195 /DNA_ORIENTATION=+